MQHLIPIRQVVSRAATLGLSINQLAKEAKISPTTISRAQQRDGCNSRTLIALQKVVIAHELELQAHLNGLHPEFATSGEAES